MKKIGILTESFMGWNGGADFIVHIINAMSVVACAHNAVIYVLIPENKTHKNYRGIKKFFARLQYRLQSFFHPRGYAVSNSDAQFPNINGVEFVRYSTSLNKVIKKLDIDFFFPHMNKRYYDFNTPNFGYLYDCQHKYSLEFFSDEEIKSRDVFFAEMTKGDIIVNAKSVKDDLVKFYSADSSKISVLPFTPKLTSVFLEDNQAKIVKYNLPEKYFISSNQFWLHKDHPTLFRAFAEFIKEEQYAAEVELVCTGTMEDSRKPAYIQELKDLIKELGIENKVHLLGLIDKIEQMEIMKGAIAVIQTTLFEGGPGGGCVYDAISLGVPSIVSDIAPNLEIEDDTAFFFKAKDVTDLVDKMKFVAEKPRVVYSKKDLLTKSENNLKKLGDFLMHTIKSK